MPRFLVTVCDDVEGCREAGRANSEESAKRKAVRAARRAARKFRGVPVPEGKVEATVYPIDRGIVQDAPTYKASVAYGESRSRGGRKRRRPKQPPPPPADGADEEW